MSVNLLTSRDFFIGKGSTGEPLLMNNIQGYSLIVFFSQQCQICGPFLNQFKMMPYKFPNCIYGVVDVEAYNRDIIRLANQTTRTRISYVPYILLFYNGKPFMEYKGPKEINDLTRFLKEIQGHYQIKQNFDKNKNVQCVYDDDGIPLYCLYKPVDDDQDGNDVCYLNYNEAYG